MSLALYVTFTLVFAIAAWLVRRRGELSASVGISGLALAVVAAAAINPGDVVSFGSVQVVASDYLRLFMLLASLVGLALGISGLAGERRDHGASITLATLGLGCLTLALADPLTAVLAGSAAGVTAAVMTVAPSGDRAGATAGIRDLRAVAIAGALAIAATAWIGRDLSELEAAQPVVYGLAYLAVATAVAIRFGAIPFHLWAARLTDAVPESALPVVTVLAAAPFAIVGAGWVEGSTGSVLVDLGAERGIVLAIAMGSVVLAGVAALLQDDLEHIVGYSIVGDAGVALLGMVAIGANVGGAMLTWILLLVVGRAAFAAWAAGLRHSMGTGRVSELRGWMTRAPVLALAFGLVVVAAIGVPGFAAFEARSTLVTSAVEGPLAPLMSLAVLAPLAYYGRLLSIGVAQPDRLRGPVEEWRPRIEPVDLTSARGWCRQTWDRNRGFSGGAVAVALALLAVATAAGAFGAPEAAAVAAESRARAPLTVPAASGAPNSTEPTGAPSLEPIEAN